MLADIVHKHIFDSTIDFNSSKILSKGNLSTLLNLLPFYGHLGLIEAWEF